MTYVLITMKPNPNETVAFQQYKSIAKEVRDENGAEVILRHNITQNILGNLEANTIRLIKFPSREHVDSWLKDPRYQKVVSLREKAFHFVTISILEDIE